MTVGLATRSVDGDIVRAFARMRSDPTLQFTFPAAQLNAHPPAWLVNFIKFVRWLWPSLKVLVWLAIAGALLAGVIYLALFFMERKRRKNPRPPKIAAAPEPWRPGEGQARALLVEADAMAAAGRFEEAAHLLLLRSVEDIQKRRPMAVRPSLTSRDIAALEVLPEAARTAFAFIASVVEASWFGGRAVDADGFARCRRVYEEFALPGAWSKA